MAEDRRQSRGSSDFSGVRTADLVAAEDFADIAQLLFTSDEVEATLSRICKLAVEHIAGCDHAGISLVERRQVTTRGATDDVAPRVDRIQYETGEGPCLDAIRVHRVFEVGDLSSDTRWPKFAPVVSHDTGVRSMLSFRLFVREKTLGALNLYSREKYAFSGQAEAEEWDAVFASHAAIALMHAQDREGMAEALNSRATIGVAMGMLMARQDVTQQEAFDILRRASQRMNVKLKTIASQIAGGDVPLDDLGEGQSAKST